MPDCDVLIVGSGPCGTAAADACIRAGATTIVLDGGFAPPPPPQPAPSHFVQLRRDDPDQWRHLLGEDLSGVPLGNLEEGRGGGNLDGDRAFVTRYADDLMPIEAHDTAVIQSLAMGGLGSAWGAVCAMWSADELRSAGLPPDEMQGHYQSVSDRIGVSGPSGEFRLMPPAHLDLHGTAILRAARRRQRELQRLGATVEQPPLALLTEDRAPRRACSYSDLEYLSDPGRSVWRPADTLDQLSEAAAFRRIGGVLVQRIEEQADEIVVEGRSISDGLLGGPERYAARHLLLAAGPLSTARILANSFGVRAALPLLNKTHWIAARLHPRGLGHSGPERRTSLCQLLVRCRDAAHESSAQLYSYRSELLSRLLPSTPLPTPEALGLLALLTPALVMADVRFPVRFPNASLRLKGDRLVVQGCPSPAELAHRRRAFAALGRVLRVLGLLPASTLRLTEGSAFHYAGTVPHAPEACFPLTVDERGCVRRRRRLWVGDASVFRSMPPLSHTLTAMANAERTATKLLQCL